MHLHLIKARFRSLQYLVVGEQLYFVFQHIGVQAEFVVQLHSQLTMQRIGARQYPLVDGDGKHFVAEFAQGGQAEQAVLAEAQRQNSAPGGPFAVLQRGCGPFCAKRIVRRLQQLANFGGRLVGNRFDQIGNSPFEQAAVGVEVERRGRVVDGVRVAQDQRGGHG